MRERPLAGAADESDDPARALAARLSGEAEVTLMTEALGASRCALGHGTARLEGRDGLVLPRLRLARGATVTLAVTARGGAGAITALMLSGGRRVSACTVRLAAPGRH